MGILVGIFGVCLILGAIGFMLFWKRNVPDLEALPRKVSWVYSSYYKSPSGWSKESE
jgi:hypothetical protein